MGVLRLTYAEREGRLWHVSRVPAGRACGCVCPVCRTGLIARKGAVLRHHFAHEGAATCHGETVLHEVAKRLLAERIRRHLRAGRPLPLAWRCDACRDAHGGDLLRRAKRVFTEEGLAGYRPDLLLVDGGGRAVAAIEIVVSHAPARAALAAYRKAGAAVVEFRLRETRHLAQFERGRELWATGVSVCQRPRCCACGRRLAARDLYVAGGHCWRCERPMRLALIMVDRVWLLGPEDFAPEERRRAEDAGAGIEERVDSRSGACRAANVCAACGTSTGTAHLADFAPSVRPAARLQRTYVCLACGAG